MITIRVTDEKIIPHLTMWASVQSMIHDICKFNATKTRSIMICSHEDGVYSNGMVLWIESLSWILFLFAGVSWSSSRVGVCTVHGLTPAVAVMQAVLPGLVLRRRTLSSSLISIATWRWWKFAAKPIDKPTDIHSWCFMHLLTEIASKSHLCQVAAS